MSNDNKYHTSPIVVDEVRLERLSIGSTTSKRHLSTEPPLVMDLNMFVQESSEPIVYYRDVSEAKRVYDLALQCILNPVAALSKGQSEREVSEGMMKQMILLNSAFFVKRDRDALKKDLSLYLPPDKVTECITNDTITVDHAHYISLIRQAKQLIQEQLNELQHMKSNHRTCIYGANSFPDHASADKWVEHRTNFLTTRLSDLCTLEDIRMEEENARQKVHTSAVSHISIAFKRGSATTANIPTPPPSGVPPPRAPVPVGYKSKSTCLCCISNDAILDHAPPDEDKAPVNVEEVAEIEMTSATSGKEVSGAQGKYLSKRYGRVFTPVGKFGFSGEGVHQDYILLYKTLLQERNPAMEVPEGIHKNGPVQNERDFVHLKARAHTKGYRTRNSSFSLLDLKQVALDIMEVHIMMIHLFSESDKSAHHILQSELFYTNFRKFNSKSVWGIY